MGQDIKSLIPQRVDNDFSSVSGLDAPAGLNRYMAMLLSERLMFTTRTLRAVSA